MADAKLSLPAPGNGFSRLNNRQKIAAMVGIAAFVALLIGAALWLRQPDFRVLFANVDDKDGAAIVESLQQMNVPYRFGDSGRSVLVPQEQVHEVRLKLAGQGLPKGGAVGFELLETPRWGLSQFAEQVNYQRALEGELARSIESIGVVARARVHLALGKRTSFMREAEKPSASVLVNLSPGRALDSTQVQAITHLVASSVPELVANRVSIVDEKGNLLSAGNGAPAGDMLAPEQVRRQHELEQQLAQRIEDILAPVVGSDNVRAQVTAELDFSHNEQTAETYKPNNNPADGVVRSQQSLETSQSGSEAAGVPGALSNQPPQPASAPLDGTPGGAAAATNTATTLRKESTINYEIDRTIRHFRQTPGVIKRLSAAVVVNHKKSTDARGVASFKPMSADEVKQITELAREAIGFSTARGDSLAVANVPFTVPALPAEPELPAWKQPATLALAQDGLKYLVLLGLAAYLIFGVLRPLLRGASSGQVVPAAAPLEPTGIIGVEREALEHPGKPPVEAAMLTEFDHNRDAVKQIASKDPKLIANLINLWVATDAG